MEALFYKFIYDKQIKRVIKMLDYLYQAKHHVTLTEIAEFLGVTPKTIYATIDLCNTHLSEEECVSIVGKEIVYSGGVNESIEGSLIKVAQKSIEFQILEYAFTNRRLTSKELADELYISDSMLRSRIKHINQALEPFNCMLSSYTVQMCGDEKNIRYFYYTYYNEIQELFISINGDKLRYVNDLTRKVNSVYQKIDAPKLHFNVQQIARWYLLIRERIVSGNYIELDGWFIDQITKRSSYGIFRSIYEPQIKEAVGGLFIPEAELVWAYVICFSATVYTAKALEDPSVTLYCDEQDNLTQKYKLEGFLGHIVHEFEIPPEHHDLFVKIHKAYFINMSLLTQVTPLFQMGSHNVRNYATSTLIELYEKWYEILEDKRLKDVVPVIYQETLASQCALLTSQLILDQKRYLKRILFSFEGEAGVAAYLEATAENILPDYVDRVFMYSDAISSYVIEAMKPDLVVCNYAVPEIIADYHYLRMSNLPTQQEWSLLRDMIMKLPHKF
ncbi:hypothetical protein AOC36_01990 [Erysipelothrix larvae]|uniref:Mga helix-turn-helix domain-containing protein n=1 Tax=Erysipelothrix larvae TaxID=1514105 RepID=A0A0X8GYK4_9FIRM|nr:helix-turn-helix domain-containing protein [Erysipelothrix larvae]AMC92796.1 hypothetical protein AOC36_01990 [Erysipelothrix larvae]